MMYTVYATMCGLGGATYTDYCTVNAASYEEAEAKAIRHFRQNWPGTSVKILRVEREG